MNKILKLPLQGKPLSLKTQNNNEIRLHIASIRMNIRYKEKVTKNKNKLKKSDLKSYNIIMKYTRKRLNKFFKTCQIDEIVIFEEYSYLKIELLRECQIFILELLKVEPNLQKIYSRISYFLLDIRHDIKKQYYFYTSYESSKLYIKDKIDLNDYDFTSLNRDQISNLLNYKLKKENEIIENYNGDKNFEYPISFKGLFKEYNYILQILNHYKNNNYVKLNNLLTINNDEVIQLIEEKYHNKINEITC